MRGHPRRFANRLARIGYWQAALIQRVSRFMQHAKQCLCDITLIIKSRDAHIGGRATTERMQRFIQPRMIIFQANARRERLAQRLLRCHGECPRQRHGRTATRLDFLSARQGIGQEGFIAGENRLHICRGDAALIAIHQRIIRCHAKRR